VSAQTGLFEDNDGERSSQNRENQSHQNTGRDLANQQLTDTRF
jgi:hypothetical protein